MRNLSVMIMMVAIVLMNGCGGDQPSAPKGNDNSTHDPVTPQTDTEASDAALWLSGELTAPEKLYEQIRDELALIREEWEDSLDAVKIGFRVPWEPGRLVMGFTQESYDSIAAGEYHHWDSLNTVYGLDTIVLSTPLFRQLKLKFQERLHPLVLADIYADLPGLRFVEPNRYYGDAAMLLLYRNGGEIVYFFRYAWENCPSPSGCEHSEYYIFTVDGDTSSFRGYSPDYNAVPPAWQSILDAAWEWYRR